MDVIGRDRNMVWNREYGFSGYTSSKESVLLHKLTKRKKESNIQNSINYYEIATVISNS
jgi:hypothetical protein